MGQGTGWQHREGPCGLPAGQKPGDKMWVGNLSHSGLRPQTKLGWAIGGGRGQEPFFAVQLPASEDPWRPWTLF